MDDFPEALVHYGVTWVTAVTRYICRSTLWTLAYCTITQPQMRFVHLVFLAMIVLVCSVLSTLFRFAMWRGVWGHPARRYSPCYDTSTRAAWRGTTRGIAWCRIRLRNLQQWQRDQARTTIRALRMGQRAYFADDDQLECFANTLCYGSAFGCLMWLCRWLSTHGKVCANTPSCAWPSPSSHVPCGYHSAPPILR